MSNKILIMSSSKLIDSFMGSAVIKPCSAIRACFNIFWVLKENKLLESLHKSDNKYGLTRKVRNHRKRQDHRREIQIQ